MGGKLENKEMPATSINDVLNGIAEKIQRNPLLREINSRNNGDFSDLIEEYGGDRVLMAKQLVESYRLLLEMNKSCSE
ncbi:MAG TPA: hypothetical protein PLE53_05430 [Bacillota bacterium]|nr:hypothetical protein [Bacillota bacterium]